MRARHAQPLYGRLGGGPPAGRGACGCLLPPWIPLPVRACLEGCRLWTWSVVWQGVAARGGLGTWWGVWQGVAMVILKFHSGLSCLTLPCSADGPPTREAGGSLDTRRRSPMSQLNWEAESLFSIESIQKYRFRFSTVSQILPEYCLNVTGNSSVAGILP
jgi:hypothetical protein